MSGLNIIAVRLMPGAICVSNSSHFPTIDDSWLLKPVMGPGNDASASVSVN